MLGGDDPKTGDQPETKPVFDLDSRGLLAIAHRMRTHFQMVVAEQPSVVAGVVVFEVEIVVRDHALRDHQIMRLVSRDRVLAVRRQRPREQESDDGDGPVHATLSGCQRSPRFMMRCSTAS